MERKTRSSLGAPLRGQSQAVLVIMDGAKALAAAVKEVFDHVVIARCNSIMLTSDYADVVTGFFAGNGFGLVSRHSVRKIRNACHCPVPRTARHPRDDQRETPVRGGTLDVR